ncbi:hypothetical protein ACJJH9_11695 [Microbulbifer sp. DLAB2-AF]|uniref:hypothetical protein n=1 Tax=Microbulbifer sp. DLAB2-AF TaxID=3243395 RepID=UPI00403A3810
MNKTANFFLGVGIFLLPIIFSWFTLRKGYSALARGLSFTWLILCIVFVSLSDGTEYETSSGGNGAITKTKSIKPDYPVSNESYSSVNNEVGCGSKYSDDKKEDVFKSKYKNRWFTWEGVVELAESDEASLNIDRYGFQDLSIEFADSKAGYDLTKGSVITVKFLMTASGGCFLPFRGEKAVILM